MRSNHPQQKDTNQPTMTGSRRAVNPTRRAVLHSHPVKFSTCSVFSAQHYRVKNQNLKRTHTPERTLSSLGKGILPCTDSVDVIFGYGGSGSRLRGRIPGSLNACTVDVIRIEKQAKQVNIGTYSR